MKIQLNKPLSPLDSPTHLLHNVTNQSQVNYGIIFLYTFKGGKKMEFLGYLAPIAFVFALAALSQVQALKKEVDALKESLKDRAE